MSATQIYLDPVQRVRTLTVCKTEILIAGDGAPDGGGVAAPGPGPGPEPLEQLLRQQLLRARRVLQRCLRLRG